MEDLTKRLKALDKRDLKILKTRRGFTVFGQKHLKKLRDSYLKNFIYRDQTKSDGVKNEKRNLRSQLKKMEASFLKGSIRAEKFFELESSLVKQFHLADHDPYNFPLTKHLILQSIIIVFATEFRKIDYLEYFLFRGTWKHTADSYLCFPGTYFRNSELVSRDVVKFILSGSIEIDVKPKSISNDRYNSTFSLVQAAFKHAKKSRANKKRFLKNLTKKTLT